MPKEKFKHVCENMKFNISAQSQHFITTDLQTHIDCVREKRCYYLFKYCLRDTLTGQVHKRIIFDSLN